MLSAARPETSRSGTKVFGKHKGTVASNLDPEGYGRIQAFVPRVLKGVPSGWAWPCVPYGGPTSGFFSVPPPGAGVWIEFEDGDTSQPIWTGCYWGRGELPKKPPGETSLPTTRIWRTETGLTVVMDDKAQTLTLTDGAALNSVEVNVANGTVTVKGAMEIVSSAPLVRHGSDSAEESAVLGDRLFKYLTDLVGAFNAHVHPGQLALGILPVVPAPPVKPMAPPTRALLSNKVVLE
ncbi:hypothetical protein G5V57_20255 [Nordella sp. HKS 07]|uniref:phage baseplate assembly protein V n=1 Tax=Nordella sp. HKS 07 TaxID=2712222 RepID=UPI0013E18427|nr:phage baseplate assembly protein V [Nordella sp. HKS 07]QIG49847.1 hypothetical protein G5V57_20255 [Nordella sp. HKS 07]